MKLKRLYFWLQLALNVVFLLVGQAAAIILGRIYYEKGGNSKWLATLVQTAGFPILLIPYFLIPSPKQQSDSSNQPLSPPSIIKVTIIYFLLGAIIAGDKMLYSTALLYLSASTYSLICATQLVFNAIFSFFIIGKKFTALIFYSVIALTLASALLAINEDSDKPLGITRWKYIIGIIAASMASALYSLILPLMQLSFQRVIKKETFSVVLKMQIYTSLVATCISTIGLFASGEWRTLSGEMQAFTTGKDAYVQVLVWTAVGWQIVAVGVVGLIFVVSSLFSNIIGTLSLAVTPIASPTSGSCCYSSLDRSNNAEILHGSSLFSRQNQYHHSPYVQKLVSFAKYKLIFIGDQSVGKSNIITRFMYDKFDKTYQQTIGGDFLSKTVFLEDCGVRLQILDAAGQMRYWSIIPRFIVDSSVAVIVYDVASRQSFLNTSEWIEKVRAILRSDVIFVLVGNKTDLVEKRQVSIEEGEAKARELNAMFIETSAEADLNIKPLFSKIVAALCPTQAGKETLSCA